MFGKNSVQSKMRSDGQILRIVKGSPFLTIQGEGPHTGKAAVFLRLHGCNLRCWFCDTEFENHDDPDVSVVDIAQMIMDVRGAARLVVSTGGEPMRQNILPLCQMLRQMRMLIQIETAGTLWIKGIERVAEIVCSPKTPAINSFVYDHACAFKYVISQSGVTPGSYLPTISSQPDTKPRQVAPPRKGAPVYLSPMDEYDPDKNAENHRAVAALAIKYNVIAGVQLHKIMELD